MANEFIARNGLIAQNNTTITGSLNVTGGVTGSISSASFATTASFAINKGTSPTYVGNAVISGSLEVKNPTPIPTGSIFAPTNSPTSLYISSSVSQSNYNITNGGIFIGAGSDDPDPSIIELNATFYITAYSNQFHSETSIYPEYTTALATYFTLNINPSSVQSPATITGYDIYAYDNSSNQWYRNSNYTSSGVGPIYNIVYLDSSWVVTSSFTPLTNSPVPVYTTFNKVGIGKSSLLNGILDINGNTIITGSLIVTNNTTGSLLGTASFSPSASSVNPLQQNVLITGSLIITGSTITTGSVVENTSVLTITSNTASLNLNNGNFFTLQLVSGSNTFINPSNIKTGQTINLLVSTTGSATVSFPSTVSKIDGLPYIPTTTTGLDLITMISFNASSLYLVYIKNLI